MFLPDVEDRVRFASLHETSGRGLSLLVEVLASCLPALPPPQVLARAVVMWSTMHGFASLKNAGVLDNIPALPSMRVLEQAAVESVLSLVSGRS
jgi:hypothetical protein